MAPAIRPHKSAARPRRPRSPCRVDLDGTGTSDISTGVGFFDHMLDQLSRHSLIDMTVEAKGDLHIDDHHTVEDTGIAHRPGASPRRSASGAASCAMPRSTLPWTRR